MCMVTRLAPYCKIQQFMCIKKIVKRVGKGQESTTAEQGTERLVKYFFPLYIV